MRTLRATLGIACALCMVGCAAGVGRDASDLKGDAATTDVPSYVDPNAHLPPTPGCGNGARTPDEACDDGNLKGGDGCAANCRSVEPGFACHPPGMPCRAIARCGDGLQAPSEACDDADVLSGDGCSERCKLELGYRCDTPGAPCEPTVCGDGKQEGAEACDDGNALAFDGCSSRCQAEPNCADSACSSRCGDGLVIDEACDDGNAKNGDGCSADCQVEAGFTCERATDCEPFGEQCVLRVAALYRDFNESHPDFQIGCGQLVTGVVADSLDADSKPVLAQGGSACIESADSFADWYRNGRDNAPIAGELVLFEDGMGGFVNRFGDNGEQFPGAEVYTNVTWGGVAGSGCDMCTVSATGQCFDPCTPWNDTAQACCGELSQTLYDGNPLFFPIDQAADALDDTRTPARIPEEYGHPGWPAEDSVYPGAAAHNFHFTTEVVYWFKYDPTTSATLAFLGDDDVWVFVNRRLAVDLGGPHVPTEGSVTIDTSSAARFGLEAGSVYEIRVFHAERKREGSSFKLTLSGFDARPSECTPICGDGLVTAGEECDDGVNDGGYEECGPDCKLGDGCGDGVIQEGEDCDDGNREDGDGCGSACVHLIVD